MNQTQTKQTSQIRKGVVVELPDGRTGHIYNDEPPVAKHYIVHITNKEGIPIGKLDIVKEGKSKVLGLICKNH